MPEHPLLIFPRPTQVNKARRYGGGGKTTKPEPREQGRRLTPQFQRLQNVLDNKRILLQDNAFGLQPEQVLVLETIGLKDEFIKAAQKLGLEWINEFEIDEIEPGNGFENEKNPEKLLKGRVFLVMSDQQALRELKRLFDLWQANPNIPFARGLAPIRNAFIHLKAIRPWDAEDRIRDTGLREDWLMRQESGQATVPFEAELWFRQSGEKRHQTTNYISNIVRELGGTIESEYVLEQIAYHAILGRIPAEHINSILNLQEVNLVRCDDIMQLRPIGQCAFASPNHLDQTAIFEGNPQGDLPEGNPVVALFDGLPLAGHQLLNGRLNIDDPDGYEDGYQASERIHGTAMASLICHGDVSEPGPVLTKPIYVRPILRPNRSFPGRTLESIPENVLPVDLIHRAVHRMFVGDGQEAPVASGVRVINLSVCDRSRPFDLGMSPWARLLDWLSWEYEVLFIVSAGNHNRPLELSVPTADFRNLTPQLVENAVIRSIALDTRHRKLLSPSETLNGLTLGSEHSDLSGPVTPAMLIDPFIDSGRPGVISAHGPGYKRSIKPDILLPGGRQLLSERLGNAHPNATLQVNGSISPPGQLVASPGPANELDRTLYAGGTSNSAALATRWASRLLQMIEDIRANGGDVDENHDVVLLKTLLVHGADWADVGSVYDSVLKTAANTSTFQDYVSRFYGYGLSNVEKVMNCTDQRVTVLGVGEVSEDHADEFVLPLPPSLSARVERRRLTITLSWLTPVNPTNQKYRIAQLWFDPRNSLAPTRICANNKAVQRGTLQHEVLEGENALDFQDGDSLAIKVNCRADAGSFQFPIKYALAVTLEVAEGIDIPIYEEVQARLQIPIAIQ